MNSKVNMARIAGILYLLIIIFGLIAQVFVRDNLVDYTNPTLTAKHIIASEFWFRFGFVSELMMLLCDIGVTTILYILLSMYSRNLSILSTLQRLASIIILAVVALSHYTALFFLKSEAYLHAKFDTEHNKEDWKNYSDFKYSTKSFFSSSDKLNCLQSL